MVKSYVAILPDKTEFPMDIEEWHDDLKRRRGISTENERKVADAALAANSKTYYSKRGEPNHIIVEVYELKIRKGTLVRDNRVVITAAAPRRSITVEEFQTESEKLLVDRLPIPFRQFVSDLVARHANNLDERLDLLEEMSEELEKAIGEYNREDI